MGVKRKLWRFKTKIYIDGWHYYIFTDGVHLAKIWVNEFWTGEKIPA